MRCREVQCVAMKWSRLLLLMAGWHARAPSIEASEPPTADRVPQLIRQLGALRQQDRAAALRELESFGPELLPLLPDADAVADAATRDTLARLRIVLQRRLARDSAQASLVTLATRLPLPDLLAELSRQTGNRLTIAADVEQPSPITVHWHATPFWNAVHDISQATGLQLDWNAEQSQWEWRRADAALPALSTAVSGPFRIAVRSLTWKPLPQRNQRLWRVSLAIQAEPRLRPLFFAVRSADWTAQADDAFLSAWNPEDDYELPFGIHGGEVSWMLNFVAPPAVQPEGEWSLVGRGAVHLAAGAEPFVFESADWPRGKRVRRGDVVVRFLPIEQRRDGERVVKLSLSYPQGGPAFESHRAGMFHRGGRMEGANGQSVPFQDFEVVAEGPGAVALEYRFDQAAADARRFVYVAPSLLLDAPVAVAFPRLPRPR